MKMKKKMVINYQTVDLHLDTDLLFSYDKFKTARGRGLSCLMSAWVILAQHRHPLYE